MKAALTSLAVLTAILTAVPTQAALSGADAGRLAELAFRATCKLEHSPMDASTATRGRDPRFVWFRTNFFLGETADGSAIFAVDRRTGAVWHVDYRKCSMIDAPELEAMRAALHLKHRASRPPPVHCHL